MVLSSKSALLPETSTPPSDTPRGTTYQSRVDDPRNCDEEGEGDLTLEIPDTTSDDKWSSLLQVDPQSVGKSEAFQKQVMSFLSDHDPAHLEEEAYRMNLLQTPVEVRVEVSVDVAASGMSSSSHQESVTTSTISSPSVSPCQDL